jgi:hypothetical protein
MSWSDDTRCLHCDGKLPLYRKITSGQFCSAAHRKAYWEEQERLAVERLHQTHDSLRAYRAPEALQTPHREPVTPPPAAAAETPRRAFVEYAQDGPTIEERARSAANTGQVTFAGFLVEARPGPCAIGGSVATCELADWLLDDSAHACSLPPLYTGLSPRSWETTPGAQVPFFDATVFVYARAVTARGEESVPFLPTPSAHGTETRIRLAARPDTPEFVPGFVGDLLALEVAVEESAPLVEPTTETERPTISSAAVEPDPAIEPPASTLTLPRIAAATNGPVAARVVPLELLEPAVQSGICYARFSEADRNGAALGRPSAAGPVPVALSTTPVDQDTQIQGADARPVDLNLTLDTPKTNIDLAALAPVLRFAPGSRYSIGSGGRPAADNQSIAEAPQLLDLKSPDLRIVDPGLNAGLNLAPGCKYAVSLRPGRIEKAKIQHGDADPVPAKPQIAMAPIPAGLGATELAPVFPRLQALAFRAQVKPAPPAEPMAAGVLYSYPANQPMQPVAKWEPIEGELQPPPKLGFLSSWSQAMSQIGQGADGEKKYVWSHVADFWQHAPRDLKLLAVAIPILLGLALRPSLPKVHVAAPAAGNVVKGMQGSSFERDFHERLMVVRQTVAERAGVELNEDFRSGLDDWQTRGDLSTAWSFDRNGFVKPGALALYRPSMGLKDYEMEFLGLIDKKALSWVVRAADFENYYVVKLVVLKPGPMPTLGITRYAVIHGKPENRVDTVAAINSRTDTLYRVNLDVHDDTYLLTLQGQVVDNWTEPRLKSGGIGFFSQQGEESRLRWVQVTHQYDMLGRLCAYLAPYNIPN